MYHGLVKHGVFLSVLISLIVIVGGQASSAQELPEDRLNIVIVMTDDPRASDLAEMPNVQALLVERGTTFENFTISLPTCCPSRATILRGQYAHNHRIGFGVRAGYRSFARRGYASDNIATRLDAAGYRTAMVGEYINDFRQERNVPGGWDRFYANAGQDVWSRTFNDNGRPRELKRGNIDAHLGRVANCFVARAADGEDPFMLWFSPNAPHQCDNGPPPAPKAYRTQAGPMPRTEAFNEANVSDKPS
jgi:N-acetylglucosamine-6-sulfatase